MLHIWTHIRIAPPTFRTLPMLQSLASWLLGGTVGTVSLVVLAVTLGAAGVWLIVEWARHR